MRKRFHFPFARALLRVTLLWSVVLGMAAAAHASFHLMQVEQVIGGVSGDVTAQAIQLRMRADGQRYLHSDAGGPEGPAALVVYDDAGANPVTLIVFSHDVANGITGDRVLIVSPGFTGHVTNAPTPDFTMTALIPAAYLLVGRLDYVDGKGDVLWSLSYGGDRYTGATAVASFNGTFGAPFAGPLPGDGTEALLFQGSATASSADNATDYALTAGPAAFVNNAGEIFQLPGASVGGSSTVSIVTTQRKVAEDGALKGAFKVTRTGDSSADLTVQYQVSGSAVAGQQYKALAGTVLIPAGRASAKIKVKPLDDPAQAGTKIVKVTLVPADGYTVGSPAKAKVKIVDAD